MLTNKQIQLIKQYYPKMITINFCKKFNMNNKDVLTYVKENKIKKLPRNQYICIECLNDTTIKNSSLCAKCMAEQIINYDNEYKLGKENTSFSIMRVLKRLVSKEQL